MPLYAQSNNLGQPFIRHFSKKDYQGGTQNWGFAQTEQGLMLVANNNGLMVFDGTDWITYPLPNRTILRSILYTGNGRTYVGGQDEVGYFEPDKMGQYIYHSLKEKLPAEVRSFADVWDISQADGQIYFRASDRVYQIGQDNANTIPSEYPCIFLHGQDDWIYAHRLQSGLWAKPPKGEFALLEGTGALSEIPVTDIIRLDGDTLLIATERQGLYQWIAGQLYPWTIDQQAYLQQERINDIALLPNQQLAIGTGLGGLLIVDINHRQTVQWLHRGSGLQNNVVRKVFVDRQQDIWLGLDNGIDYVNTSAPFRQFFPDEEEEGASYAVQIADGKLFIGNVNGLWQTDWQSYYDPFQRSGRFKKVAGTSGQVWGLDWLDEQLWIGHQEGAFVLKKGRVKKVSPSIGYWKYLTYPHSSDSVVLAGTYFGLVVFAKENGGWVYQNILEGLDESCRILERGPDNDLWMSHPYRGVYRLSPNEALSELALDLYGEDKGLPSLLGNHVTKISNRILVCAETGVYNYNRNENAFSLDPEFEEQFGADIQMRRLFQDRAGNIWFVSRESVGVLDIKDAGLSKRIQQYTFPQIRPFLVGGFELIYPYDEHNIFFGAEKGVIHYDHSRRTNTLIEPQTLITAVNLIIPKDSVIREGHFPALDSNTSITFKPWQNAFRFSFSGTHFSDIDALSYQYRLVGLDEDWTAWGYDQEREYTNLKPGQYQFLVRARLNGGAAGPETRYSFAVAPHWYQTTSAFIAYAAMALLLLWSLISIPRRRYEREKAVLKNEQAKQAEAHRQQVEVSEHTIDQLKNEKLQAEVTHKNRELASLTMHLVQKNELLNKIGEHIDKIEYGVKQGTNSKQLRQLKSLLRQDQHLDDDWEQFAYHFDQVHHNFLSRLREAYPQLTPKDHRLCAYLRLNLSTKELAPLMNISVRGIEISRYRLRKKMTLDKSVNLNEFMLDF